MERKLQAVRERQRGVRRDLREAEQALEIAHQRYAMTAQQPNMVCLVHAMRRATHRPLTRRRSVPRPMGQVGESLVQVVYAEMAALDARCRALYGEVHRLDQ